MSVQPTADSPITDLAATVRRGERRALARAVTLVESTRPDHRKQAEALVEAILPATGKAMRLGISGPPGAGKSTFIERFGLLRKTYVSDDIKKTRHPEERPEGASRRMHGAGLKRFTASEEARSAVSKDAGPSCKQPFFAGPQD